MKHENAIQCLQVMKGAECINALSQEFPEHYGMENIEALELAIEVLKKNQWTPCSERLPEESGKYLAQLDWENITVITFSKKWQKWNAFDSHPPEHEMEVIAWMLLPEPYKEQTKK